MRLSVSDKYPQVFRKTTQIAQIQSRRQGGTFMGLSPLTKFQPSNVNVKH